MRKFILNIVLIITSFILSESCKSSINKESINKSEPTLRNNSDSLEITTLVRNMYKWYSNEGLKPEFYPTDTNTILTGIDWKRHEERMNEFVKTNFFSNEFIDNYHEIALQIDSIIRNSKTKYDTRLIPPFRPDVDVNAWCNCQDTPDNYWERITITNLKVNKDNATFKWTFGSDYFYTMKTRKENSIWKVSYLEGFEKKKYTE
ncbi:MAG: hypothetical protein AB9846_13965 [Tenuifilaceae bacterium]